MTAQDFVGLPWEPLAQGPATFDCWGLTRVAARALFDLEFPELIWTPQTWPGAPAAGARIFATPGWRECDSGAQGRVMALCSYAGDVHHVALCVDASRVLHTARSTRSAILPLARLASVYPLARFYEWAR